MSVMNLITETNREPEFLIVDRRGNKTFGDYGETKCKLIGNYSIIVTLTRIEK